MSPPTNKSTSGKVHTSKSNYRGKTDYRIAYQDQHILVVNKPPGLLTVPIKGIKSANVEELLARDLKYKYQVKAAHRIDRYTSGLVAFGLHKKSHEHLKKQFLARSPERIYLAVTKGVPEPEKGNLVHYLKQIKAGFRNVVTSPNAKGAGRAELEYEVIEDYGQRALVRIRLISGLKNQIRVQFAEIGYPLIGDRHYKASEKKRPEINRQALHAAELSFLHPVNEKPVSTKALLPPDMKRALSAPDE